MERRRADEGHLHRESPAFRSSKSDHLLQMADLIAHALLKQEEELSRRVERLGIDRAFNILDRALNRNASRRDS